MQRCDTTAPKDCLTWDEVNCVNEYLIKFGLHSITSLEFINMAISKSGVECLMSNGKGFSGSGGQGSGQFSRE